MANFWDPNDPRNQNIPSFGQSIEMGKSYGGTQSDQNWAKALDLGLKIFGGADGSSGQDKWRNEAEEAGKREERWKDAYQTANTARVADNAVIYNPPGNFDSGKAFLQQGLQQGASGGGSTWGKIAAGAGTALSAGAAAGVLGPVAAIAGPVLGLFCDERLKTDIAPLERSDVHDELAEMAFLVKEIRECV